MSDYRYPRRRNGNSAFVIFLLISAVFFIASLINPAKSEELSQEFELEFTLPTDEVAFLVDNDDGGVMATYIDTAKMMAGSKVIITGHCLSACTLFLRKDFELDVCMTTKTVFGFHMPYSIDPETRKPIVAKVFAESSTKLWREEFYEQMPASVQAKLEGKHIPSASTGDDPGLFLMVGYRGLVKDIPLCPIGWQTKYVVMPKPKPKYLAAQ